MIYQLKQEIFSLTDSYVIKNENNEEVYFVDSQLLSFGKKLSFKDSSGNEQLTISENLFSIPAGYEIYKNDSLYATMNKEFFNIIGNAFNIELTGSSCNEELGAEGAFLQYEYCFILNNKEIARVNKDWPSLSDTYSIDIKADQDDVLIIACAIVIDIMCFSGNK